ncbi:MAG: HAD family hydrolase [Bacillota bacterium]
MAMLKDIKTIFFDYDGTLHDSMKIYGPAFRKAFGHLVEHGFVENRQWSDNEISYWLGFSSKEMWQKFMPDLDEKIREECSKIIGSEMTALMEEKKAVLYCGALETIKYLKNKGYHLVFLSNCGIYYRDKARELFNLDFYFEETACSEEYRYMPKYEILEKIMNKCPREMAIVGDRIHDIEAGKINNIYTIGCRYGFGSLDELSQADLIISDIRELMNYL